MQTLKTNSYSNSLQLSNFFRPPSAFPNNQTVVQEISKTTCTQILFLQLQHVVKNLVDVNEYKFDTRFAPSVLATAWRMWLEP